MTLTCEARSRATDNQTWIFIDSSDLSNQLHITITSASDVGTVWLNRTILSNITAIVILAGGKLYVKNGFHVLKTVTLLENTGHNRGNLSVICINSELGTSTTIVMEDAEMGIYTMWPQNIHFGPYCSLQEVYHCGFLIHALTLSYHVMFVRG